MPFCPQCQYEYVEEITHCADCGAELVESLPEIDFRNSSIKWVKLNSLPGRVYAEMVKEVLDREGIPSRIIGGVFDSQLIHGTEGTIATIFVPQEYFERSKRIQNEMFNSM